MGLGQQHRRGAWVTRRVQEKARLARIGVSHFCNGLLIASLLMSWSCSITAPAKVVEKDSATRLQEKIDALMANGAKSPVAPQSITLAQDEVNLFLASFLKKEIPQGIEDPHVTMLGNARIVARVLVDVDEFKRKSGRKTASGPLNFFSGKIPVLLRGELTGREGQGQFRLVSAEANGLGLPRALVLELLATHTRTRENPRGFELEKPFDLPLKIRELTVQPGELSVLQ